MICHLLYVDYFTLMNFLNPGRKLNSWGGYNSLNYVLITSQHINLVDGQEEIAYERESS